MGRGASSKSNRYALRHPSYVKGILKQADSHWNGQSGLQGVPFTNVTEDTVHTLHTALELQQTEHETFAFYDGKNSLLVGKKPVVSS